MTVKIQREVIGDVDFAARVQSYCDALKEWSTKVGVPPPTEHPLVESAVKRVSNEGSPPDFVPDFEIIEPPPAPEPTKEELKYKALVDSRKLENDEISGLMSAGKVRLLGLEYTDAISTKEEDRTSEHNNTIAEMIAYSAKVREIQKRGAKREADIEDQFSDA